MHSGSRNLYALHDLDLPGVRGQQTSVDLMMIISMFGNEGIKLYLVFLFDPIVCKGHLTFIIIVLVCLCSSCSYFIIIVHGNKQNKTDKDKKRKRDKREETKKQKKRE
jgi:hypothetical protein